MKKISYLAITIVALLTIFILGCATATPDDVSTASMNVYTSTKLILPVLEPDSSGAGSRAWSSGNSAYELFNLLRDFNPATDEGKIDRSNIYKMLYDTQNLYEGLSSQPVALPSPEVLKPPFDFGNNRTYDKVKNNLDSSCIATSSENNVMISWIWSEASDVEHKEYGILEAKPNKNIDLSTDFTLDFVFSVDYNSAGADKDATTDYNMRSWYSGNPSTHEFKYKSTRGSGTNSSSVTAMVGAGTSSGTDEYYMFKMSDTSSGSGVRYFVLPTSADETYLKNIDANLSTMSWETTTDIPAATLANIPTAVWQWIANESFFTWSEMMNSTDEMTEGDPTGTINIKY